MPILNPEPSLCQCDFKFVAPQELPGKEVPHIDHGGDKGPLNSGINPVWSCREPVAPAFDTLQAE